MYKITGLFLILMLVWQSNFAQDNVDNEGFTVETESRDDEENTVLSNKGVFITPYYGLSLNLRTSNSSESDKFRLGSDLGAAIVVGIDKYFGVGVRLQRNGFYFKAEETRRAYSTNISALVSVIVDQNGKVKRIVGADFGLPEMIQIREGTLFQNDSTFELSEGGKSFRIFYQEDYKINSGLSIYYEFGLQYMHYPEILTVTLANPSKKGGQTVLSNTEDPNSTPLKYNWTLASFSCGIKLKL